MYDLARLVFFAVAITASLCFAEEFEEDYSNAPLQCYICATHRNNDAVNQSTCLITSPNVKVAQCAKDHGYDRCIYYRARSLETGAVLLRRQCATQKMCEGRCLFSNHTNCQMRCCQDHLCNDWLFEDRDGYEWPTTGVKEEISEERSVTTVTTDIPVTQDEKEQDNGSKRRPVAGPRVTQSDKCQDYRKECGIYASFPFYCLYWNEFMREYCPLSCAFCEPSGGGESVTETAPVTSTRIPETTRFAGNGDSIAGGPHGCQDVRKECREYANISGYCDYNSDFMITQCPRACEFCVGTDEIPDARGPTNPSQLDESTTQFSPGEEGQLEQSTTPSTTPFGPGEEESESDGCFDLRKNCTYYANEDGYCDYNREFMSFNCAFTCNLCETASTLDTAFPHPPIFHDPAQKPFQQDFPKEVLPTGRGTRWIPFQCSECRQGYQRCSSACILLYDNGSYKQTNYKICLKLLGKPQEKMQC